MCHQCMNMQEFIFLVIFGTALCETAKGVYKVPKINITKHMWEDDIKTQSDLFAKYFKEREFTELSHLFTRDCAVLPPGARMVSGRQATAHIYATLPEAGVDSVKLISHGVIVSRNSFATNKGVVILREADGTTLDICKYVIVWRRVKGEAKFDTAIWNSDSPIIVKDICKDMC